MNAGRSESSSELESAFIRDEEGGGGRIVKMPFPFPRLPPPPYIRLCICGARKGQVWRGISPRTSLWEIVWNSIGWPVKCRALCLIVARGLLLRNLKSGFCDGHSGDFNDLEILSSGYLVGYNFRLHQFLSLSFAGEKRSLLVS